MPSAADILRGLSAIANQATGVAVAWHVLVAAALVALASGWRPSQRAARLLIGMPLASVAGAAAAFDNPFNGLVFAASALVMTALAVRGDRRPVSRGPHWTRGTGVALIAFGWVYPHFLDGPAVAYLYASPVGLVPCPTLAMGVGFALLGNGLGSRAWGLTLATVGLFYGLFGVLRLAVFLDIALVAGAMALIAAEFRSVVALPRDQEVVRFIKCIDSRAGATSRRRPSSSDARRQAEASHRTE